MNETVTMNQTMTEEEINMFLTANAKYFDATVLPIIKQKLQGADRNKLLLLQAAEFKDPTTMLIISLFLGSWGIDRFMLGDTGMGILKVLTGGLCGILTIIDWFQVSGKAKAYNFSKINTMI